MCGHRSCCHQPVTGNARAAVANGADAIYFGLDNGFNARGRATNFPLDELPRLMEFLHRHGVAGYVTTNILAFSDELESLEDTIRQIALARADAVLVQDLGLVQVIRRVAPELPIHASTQMTLTCAESINIVRRLGVERVVLRVSCRCARSLRSTSGRRCTWRSSCTAPCAWPTAASV